MPHDIWKRCKRSDDVLVVEEEVLRFLKEFHLDDRFSVSRLERDIYDCSPGEEELIFSSILEVMQGGTLADLKRFDNLFRIKFFSHIPQKVLGGFSPVKYALFLKNMKDTES